MSLAVRRRNPGFPRGPGGLLGGVRNAARLGLFSRFRQRNSRSFTNQKRSKQTRSGQGVTTQHDARLIYRKRRMPRGRRRRWKRFRNKVLSVSEKDLGTQQIVFNRVLPTSFTQNLIAGQQLVTGFGLYTLRSGSSWYNDLSQIATYFNNAAMTSATGLPVDPSTKIIFQSAVLDVTVRNNSTNNNNPDSAARMEVDVYELTMKHTAEETGTTYSTLEGILSQNISQTKAIGGGATTKIDYFSRGATPFDLSYVLSRFGIKIYKKTKYQLSNGDQFTYQMRDPARHSVTFREISNQDGFNLPRLSKFVLIIGKLAPGLSIGPTGVANQYQEQLAIGITRKYVCKVENYTEDRSAYDLL